MSGLCGKLAGFHRRMSLLRLAAVLGLGLLVACGRSPRAQAPGAGAPAKSAAKTSAMSFVGRAACEKCHAEEAKRWAGSHHELAMQQANEKTVLGDFRTAK